MSHPDPWSCVDERQTPNSTPATVMTTEHLDSLIVEPAETYHQRARDGECLSSHLLGTFRHCAETYRRKMAGLIKEKSREAFTLGRAAHALILEGREVFDEEFMVGGPVNPKTGKPYGADTKRFREWLEAEGNGRDVLTGPQYAQVETMATAVAKHESAQQLLQRGWAERVARTKYCGTPCQIRMDWLNPTLGLVDLKTCDNLDFFASDANRYGYRHQLAFYRDILTLATGWRCPQVCIIAVEKREPFRVGVWLVADALLADAGRENAGAIRRLRRLMQVENPYATAWPTGYEDPRTLV